MIVKDNMDNHSNYPFDPVSRIVASYAGRPDVTQDEIMTLTQRLLPIFGASVVEGAVPQPTAATAPAPVAAMKPAVPIEKAVSDDKVTCLCCGRSFTMLKRHLKAEHGLTEDEYRAAFGLPEDFPLVAPKYSERKAAYAKKVGLGKYSRDAEADQGVEAR